MWWFGQTCNHLPVATGPFMPGCMDVMLGYNKEDPFLRLYYPTSETHAKDNVQRFIPWIPDSSYLTGISKVLMIHVYILRAFLWWADRKYTPVLYGAKVKSDEKLKCIIMSHGLGGNRFLYTNICCELASRGFLVACLEHRDLSACNTYYYKDQKAAQEDKRTVLDFTFIKLGENHYKERNEQIKIRSQECSEVADFLINLNRGVVPYNIMNDAPTTHKVLFQLEDLVGKLDVDSLTMMGHSFGAATALYTVSKRKEFKQCILLDPWMFPVKNESLETTIEQPLLFINTQTFHIKQNVNAMSKFLTSDDRKMYTIKHTTHENQTDSVLLLGYWLNWFMKKLDPVEALKINNTLILQFLNERVGFPGDIEQHQKYLEEQKDNVEFGLTRPWA